MKPRELIAEWRERAKTLLADAPQEDESEDGELSTYTCLAGALCGCANELEASLAVNATAPDMLNALAGLLDRCDRELADPEGVYEVYFARQVIAKAANGASA